MRPVEDIDDSVCKRISGFFDDEHHGMPASKSNGFRMAYRSPDGGT